MDGGPSEVYASSGAADFCAGMNPLSLKDLLKGCLLVAFFEKPPMLPWNLKSLSKTHQSSLTLKGGSTSHLGLLPSGKKRKPLLSIVFTTPSVPLIGDRNVARNHFILRLADHQRSSPAAELRFFVRDKPPCGRASDGNAGTQINTYYFEPAFTFHSRIC